MYKNEFLESNNIQNRDLNHNLNQASYSIHPNILKKNNTNRMETLKQTNSNNSQSNNEFSQKNPTGNLNNKMLIQIFPSQVRVETILKTTRNQSSNHSAKMKKLFALCR